MGIETAKRFTATVLVALGIWTGYVHAWDGWSHRVIDGDTTIVRSFEGIEHRVRLYGIDCPESGQPLAGQATKTATRLMEGKPLEVKVLYHDRYGRRVAVVALPDGLTLQEMMLLMGLAWIDERYCKLPECEAWRLLDVSARLSNRGIWENPRPVPPWEWRKGKRD